MSTSKQIFTERVRSPFSSHNDSLIIILGGFDRRRFENHRPTSSNFGKREHRDAVVQVFISRGLSCKSPEAIPARAKGIAETSIKVIVRDEVCKVRGLEIRTDINYLRKYTQMFRIYVILDGF